MQKTTNILRFRRYLAEGYQKEDTVIENGETVKTPLEIITEDEHILLIPEETANNPLYQKMAHRLLRAIASEGIRRKMDLEDDIERDYQDITTKFNKAKKELEAITEELAEKDEKLAEQERLIAELMKKLNL